MNSILGICEEKKCTGCTLCASVCKHGAIVMRENEEGFLYPEIDEHKCINCGVCVKKCPVNHNTKTQEARFYMGWHRNKNILLSSSSGGAFSAIASQVLRKGGVVFGATKDSSTKEITHQMAQTEEELSALRGSKYYQSNVNRVYVQVRKYLNAGKSVLFSGTSCQVAALYSYLGEHEYENLITVDILCHGITSKKVIDEYITSQEKRFARDIDDYSFRVKEGRMGWQCGRMQLFFEDNGTKVMEAPYDTFFLGFNNNFFLRESCYSCKYCGTQRVADFTLGDFWGCSTEKVSAEQLWNGVSLILVNSNKAENLLPSLHEEMEIVAIDAMEAIPFNQSLSCPQKRPAYRDVFFEVMERKGFDKSIQQKFPYRFAKFRVKNLLRKILPREIAVKIMKNI